MPSPAAADRADARNAAASSASVVWIARSTRQATAHGSAAIASACASARRSEATPARTSPQVICSRPSRRSIGPMDAPTMAVRGTVPDHALTHGPTRSAIATSPVLTVAHAVRARLRGVSMLRGATSRSSTRAGSRPAAPSRSPVSARATANAAR